MFPYQLCQKAIRQFMEYHELKNLASVAEMLCISAPYLTQLMSGQRKLNEEMRLRIQIVTHKRQDQLFLPNEKAMPFTHQSFNMAKFYGVKPYEQGSLNLTFQEKDAGEKEDRSWMEQPDGRAKHYKTRYPPSKMA
jgi:plasmid maintenance system antidote protein VapI